MILVYKIVGEKNGEDAGTITWQGVNVEHVEFLFYSDGVY